MNSIIRGVMPSLCAESSFELFAVFLCLLPDFKLFVANSSYPWLVDHSRLQLKRLWYWKYPALAFSVVLSVIRCCSCANSNMYGTKRSSEHE